MILLQIWISVGILPLMWAVRKLIHEEKQISNPDRSFYQPSRNHRFLMDEHATFKSASSLLGMTCSDGTEVPKDVPTSIMP